MLKRVGRLWFALLATTACVHAATLLPDGEQTFLDQNGKPLSGGQVYFYIPNTSTPKSTYKNSGQTVANTNPVVLDSSGRGIIYGSGQYRQKVTDASGNLIWDQLTADTSASTYSWANTSAGSANNQTVTAPNFTSGDGQQIGFIAGLSNTGAFSLTPNSGSPINVVKATSSGPSSLVAGDIVAGNQYIVTYSASNGNFQLGYVTSQPIQAASPIASAATVDIGSIVSHNASITGSTTITSFGSSASVSSQFYFVTFTGSPLVTEGPSLLTPTGSSIRVVSGATALLAYLGSGQWQIVTYTAPVQGPQITTFTTGSGTYTPPTGATYLLVEECGAGSGGSGAGTTTTGGASGAGGATSFGSFTANGGSAAPTSGTSSYPSAATASSGDVNVAGGLGASGNASISGDTSQGVGGNGASSPFGSGGPGGTGASVSPNAGGGFCSGGGGGVINVNVNGFNGWGGNSGAYLRKRISPVAASYTYSVGAGGTAGAAGTSGTAGAAGASGYIIVTAYFN